MARRSKASRVVKSTRSIPTPIHSTYTTPISSAYPSAYPSEDEAHEKPAPKPPKPAKPAKPFKFLDLPPELRLRVYGFYFADCGEVVDLDPDNYTRIHKRMAIFRSCRTIYHEATTFFYHTQTFRIFPCHPGRFFKTKRPLLARLTPAQRSDISSLELRLGPGWNKPARGWVVNDALGLVHCTNVRRLRIFVECDPSDSMFNGFRRADGFYEDFCRKLLEGVLERLPAVQVIEFDAWESVQKSGAMMSGLIEAASKFRLAIQWGPIRGWTDQDEEEFAMGMTLLNLGGHGVLDTTVAA